MTIDEVYQLGESSKKLEEEVKPSFGDTFKAALRTSVTGATTAFDTIERKHVMPSNEGEDNYYNTQEFKDIISKEAPKISVTELSELYDAKNANYLRAKIQNQKNYLGAIDTIEKAGGTGMAVEVATSLADLPSWLVGGVIFKGAKVAKTALDINKAGAKMLYDIGTGGLAAGTAVTASEAMIQGEAGVQLNDRLENTAMYGTAFGLALPAIAHTISGVAQGGARQSIANNLNTLIDNVPGSGSLRGLFSVSSANQALYKTDNPIVNDWGARSTTRSSAAKDANGNFVTATNDTAMNYKDTLIDSTLSTVGASMAENSKRYGIAFDKINEEDGHLFHQFANSVDQTVGREVALLDEASLLQQYKDATGITELPHETKLAGVTAKYDKMVNDAKTIAKRDLGVINTQKQKIINEELSKFKETYTAIHTGDVEKIGELSGRDRLINENNASYYGDSVFGENATYLDNDGRWLKGEHGLDLSKKKYIHQVQASFNNPFIITDKNLSNIEEILSKEPSIWVGNNNDVLHGDRLNKYLRDKGYDGVVVKLEKDKSYIPSKEEIDKLDLPIEVKNDIKQDPNLIFILRNQFPSINEYLKTIDKNSYKINALLQNQIVALNPEQSIKTLKRFNNDGSVDINSLFSADKLNKEQYTQKVIDKVNKQFKAIENTVNKQTKKALKDAEKFKEKNAITRDDLPEDLYDVVISHNKTKMFDDGRLVVPERLKYLEDFFVKFGKEATDHELRGIAGKESRGYIHTMWNTDAILADLQGSKAKIQEMLLDDELTKARLARNEITLEEVAKKAEDMVNSISTKDFTRKFIDETRGVTSTSATKQKTMRVNKALYPELFVTNVDSLASDYAERIGGKLALKKTFGIDSDKVTGRLSDSLEKEYRRVAEEGQKLGHSTNHIKRDVANVKAIAETILGVNRYQHNPHEALATTARLLKKGSSALYSAGFVKYAIIEPTVAIMRYGLKNTLKQYVPAIKSMQEHINNAKPNDPMVKVMRQAGLAVNTLRALKYDRFNNFDATASRSKGEMFLDKMSHISRKYSGFNYINDINDYVAGGAALSELQEVMVRPHKLSNSEASRMARYGLSSDDLAKINNEAIIKDANGNVTDWNTDAWKDQELSARFLRYLGSSTRDTIMRADGTRVHRYQADANNILGSMAFQFTQMPTALYERVLLNMKDEVAARSFVGMFMATSFMYTLLELEDMAKVKTGAKDARDSHEQLLTQAITRTPFVGILPNFIDAGLMLTGKAPLGSAYTPHSDLASLFLGAGYSTGNKALKALQGLGDGIDGTDASNMLKLVPILNSLPILSVGMKALEHDFKTDNGGVSDVSANYNQPLHNIFKEQ